MFYGSIGPALLVAVRTHRRDPALHGGIHFVVVGGWLVSGVDTRAVRFDLGEVVVVVVVVVGEDVAVVLGLRLCVVGLLGRVLRRVLGVGWGLVVGSDV